MRQVAFLKRKDDKGRELFHLNVRATPNGRVIGTLDPGVLFQLTGKEHSTATVSWVEGHYAGNGEIIRGWASKKNLDIIYESDFDIPILSPNKGPHFRWFDLMIAAAPFVVVLWGIYLWFK